MKKFFKGIICTLCIVGVFAAGQTFTVFPNPDIVFWGIIAVIVLLFVGYFFGIFHTDSKSGELEESQSDEE